MVNLASDKPPLTDAQARRLIKLYDGAEKEILKEINRLLLKSTTPEYSLAWQRTVLQRVQQIRGQLLEGSRTWCQEAIPDSYMKGVDWADKDPLSGNKVLAGFGSVHQQAAQVLAENTYSRFVGVDQIVGRQVDDIFRAVALENVKGAVIGYQTTAQAARRIRQDLEKRGVTGFVDKAGHEWSLSRYAKVAAQESTNQSFRQGTINRFQEKGHDLVRLSEHSSSCPKCVPYQGRTFSLSGNDKEFPPLDQARAGGVFHVGCLHVLSLAPEEKDRFLERLQGKQGEAARQKEIDRLAKKAGWKSPFVETSPEKFIESRDKLPKELGAFLSPYTAEDYKASGVKLKLHESGNGGYGLKGDELISVFSLPGNRLGSQLIDDAIANGATDKWDEQYAPKNWNYDRFGTPDLYYMELEK